MSARLRLGTSSWNYKDWVGPFYPPATAPADMLAFYARVFPSVEVDASYYGIPRASTVEGWRRRSPEGFCFSLKTPAAVTHERRFVNAGPYFASFVARARMLGDRLGAILLQCPPDFTPSRETRASLFGFLETELPGDLPIALELRDPRWYDDALFDFAAAIGCTVAVTEGVHADLALASRIVAQLRRCTPAPYAYIRWLGEHSFEHWDREQLDRTGSLDVWERLIRALQDVCQDIYGYASNDYAGYAPGTVRQLFARLGAAAPPQTGEMRLL